MEAHVIVDLDQFQLHDLVVSIFKTLKRISVIELISFFSIFS